jgi:hypothetical protein
MPTPLAPQGFIVKALDLSETTRSRKSNDILPFLVTLQGIYGEFVELLPGLSVLENLPDTAKSIYT